MKKVLGTMLDVSKLEFQCLVKNGFCKFINLHTKNRFTALDKMEKLGFVSWGGSRDKFYINDGGGDTLAVFQLLQHGENTDCFACNLELFDK